MTHAQIYRDRDGAPVRALQFDGRIAGFFALLAAFPARIAPHPQRDDALLVQMLSGRAVRIEAGDWVAETEAGQLRTFHDDEFASHYASVGSGGG